MLAGATAYDELYGIYVSYSNASEAKNMKKALRSIKAAKKAPKLLVKPKVTLKEIEFAGLKLKTRPDAKIVSSYKNLKSIEISLLASAAGIDGGDILYVENRYLLNASKIKLKEHSLLNKKLVISQHSWFRAYTTEPNLVKGTKVLKSKAVKYYKSVIDKQDLLWYPGQYIFAQEVRDNIKVVTRNDENQLILNHKEKEGMQMSYGTSPVKAFEEGMTILNGVVCKSTGIAVTYPIEGAVQNEVWELKLIVFSEQSLEEAQAAMASIGLLK